MSNIHWQGVVAGIVLGVLLAPQLSKIPGFSKIPSV